MTEPRTFSSREVATLVGVTYRQIDYWCRAGLLPDQPWGSAIGSGGRRRLTYRDLTRAYQLRIVSQLRTRSFVEVVRDLQALDVLDSIADRLGIRMSALPAPESSTRRPLPPPETRAS